MKVALVVGHTHNKGGAYNKELGISEFVFNSKLANDVKEILDSKQGIEPVVVYRDVYKNLPADINKHNPDLVISFHCNAFDTKASGTETLFYYKSQKGRDAASIFQDNIVSALKLPDRGIKGKSAEERGGFVLRYTSAPCIILEPFFIDNSKDLDIAFENYDKLVNAIISSLENIKEIL